MGAVDFDRIVSTVVCHGIFEQFDEKLTDSEGENCFFHKDAVTCFVFRDSVARVREAFTEERTVIKDLWPHIFLICQLMRTLKALLELSKSPFCLRCA